MRQPHLQQLGEGIQLSLQAVLARALVVRSVHADFYPVRQLERSGLGGSTAAGNERLELAKRLALMQLYLQDRVA